jgi:hypothetical protein
MKFNDLSPEVELVHSLVIDVGRNRLNAARGIAMSFLLVRNVVLPAKLSLIIQESTG